MTRKEAKKHLPRTTHQPTINAFWSGYEFGRLEYGEEQPFNENEDPPLEHINEENAWWKGYECGHEESPRNFPPQKS